jgi:hypothetical protein
LDSDIIQEQDVPIEEDDIPTDAIDYDESIEEDIVLAEWDKDEYDEQATTEKD